MLNRKLGLFRRQLLVALGLPLGAVATLHCGGEIIVEGGTGGAGTTVATTGTTNTSASQSSSQSSSTGIGGNAVGGAGGSGGECTGTTSTGTGVPSDLYIPYCVPDNVPCNEQSVRDYINQDLGNQCCLNGDSCDYLVEMFCGPIAHDNSTCCYDVHIAKDFCGVGRPYRVQGVPMTPAVHGACSELSPVAEYWMGHAQAEHASIASFSQLALDLLALGAPSNLIEAAAAAAADEARHASATFKLASYFSGTELRAGAMKLAPPTEATTLEAFVRSTIIDGCIGETLCVFVAQEQLAQATAPSVKETLEQIVADESRHAELAWQLLDWSLGQAAATGNDSLLAICEDAFDRATQLAPITGFADSARDAHDGLLSQSDVDRVWREGITAVLLPCWQELRAKHRQVRDSAEVARARPPV